MNLGGFPLLHGFGQVRRNVAHHSFDRAAPRMDSNSLGFGNGRINPAQFADIDKPLFIDEIDDHRDFVGVGGKHQAW